ncbi:MAG: DEAD/DEAH box helicase [Phycisphaerales bacterium]|jgi:superfamily II DNA/RNA helicase|nr:DEAD/DEAH box helicase [Phycisphaerales bacterium]
MYDPATAQLVRNAQRVLNIDPDALPETLTRIFASLVSARLEITESTDAFRTHEPLLVQAANIYGIQASLSDRPERVKPAAFVSATALNLIGRAAKVGLSTSTFGRGLTRSGIPSCVSASLLFLIAGYHADAYEAIRGVDSEPGTATEKALMDAIARLVRGEQQSTLNEDRGLELDGDDEDAPHERALQALWRQVFHGVRLLSQRILSMPSEDRPSLQDAQAIFLAVQNAAMNEMAIPEFEGRTVLTTFAGPHHLATLLLRASAELGDAALIDVPPPPGTNPDAWIAILSGLASRRPYLWQNHRDAISKGLLRPGSSAVLGFPTGAGKSTLSELRIAAALATGGKVVFLAPTLALVGQTVRTFRLAFPEHRVADSMVGEGYFADIDERELPDIAVMTPERCLFLLGLYPDIFSNVHLLVFDECHLLHPDRNERRAIDAMLCVLSIFENAPNADHLYLSAMMENVEELAKWLCDATGRSALGLRLDWKPTRQARGCVVYPNKQVQQLQKKALKQRRAKGKKRTKNPPAALKKTLQASSHAVFCLRQTWDTEDQEDFTVVPLLNETVLLAINNSWKITANKNVVATALAERLAEIGMKTIVFAQNRQHVESIARSIEQQVELGEPNLNGDEARLLEQAKLEMGNSQHVIGVTTGSGMCHHSLMLSYERELSESLFARENGANVIVATPTLAQGMNLPAEAVIIAGDGRFVADAEASEQVAAHELLNAAGRAGRAGYAAMGIVILIPGEIMTIPDANSAPDRNLLREGAFARPDQCLHIDDPVEHLLDRLQATQDPVQRTVLYFLNRLPSNELEHGEDRFNRLLKRSLGAFRARQAEYTAEFDRKTAEAWKLRAGLLINVQDKAWYDQLASSTGIPATLLQNIDESIDDPPPAVSTLEWIETCIDWLCRNDDRLAYFLSVSELQSIFKNLIPASKCSDAKRICSPLRESIKLWVGGHPLCEIERALGTPEAKLRTCTRARRLVRRLVIDLSYVMGLFPQVVRLRAGGEPSASSIPLTLATSAACLREGFDRPEQLALRHGFGRLLTRVEVHALYNQLQPHLDEGPANEDFLELRRRVQMAADMVS